MSSFLRLDTSKKLGIYPIPSYQPAASSFRLPFTCWKIRAPINPWGVPLAGNPDTHIDAKDIQCEREKFSFFVLRA